MKAQLGMMDLEFGFFSATFVFGRIWGSLFWVAIINVVNRKAMMVCSLLATSLSVIAFYFINDGVTWLTIRFISGFAGILPVIYASVFVNQVCSENLKYIMFTLLAVGEPIGFAYGFIANYFFGKGIWRTSYLIDGIIIGITGLLFISFPSIYFSSKLVATPKVWEEDASEVREVSLFNIRFSDVDERDANFIKKYSVIFTNPIYVFALFGAVINIGTCVMLQFWMFSYLETVIKHNDPAKILVIFLFMIIFWPVIGAHCGSYLVKYVGGYDNKKALIAVMFMDLFACSLFFPITYMNTWYGFLACAASFQVFGNALIPSLNGIVFSSIPSSLKAKGVVIAKIMTIIFGAAPSPLIYALINDAKKNHNPRFALKYFTIWNFVGLICIAIAAIYRNIAEDKKELKEPFTQQEEKKVEISGTEWEEK